jgi:hypothetical protein
VPHLAQLFWLQELDLSSDLSSKSIKEWDLRWLVSLNELTHLAVDSDYCNRCRRGYRHCYCDGMHTSDVESRLFLSLSTKVGGMDGVLLLNGLCHRRLTTWLSAHLKHSFAGPPLVGACCSGMMPAMN